LRTRFNGKSKFLIVPVVLLLVLLSYSIYHQDFAMCKGLYTIGVSKDVPAISDKRFNVQVCDIQEGRALLANRKIDLYLSGDVVLKRNDERSQYAAGALQKYLENQELARISEEYEISRAFPLRIEIDYLDTEEENLALTRIEASAGFPELQAVQSEDSAFLSPALTPGTAGDVINGSETVQAPLNPPNSQPGVDSGSAREPCLEDIIPGPLFGRNSDSPEDYSSPVRPDTFPLKETDLTSLAPVASETDSIVQQQLEDKRTGSASPKFKAEFVSENEVIIPSLMTPPIPLAQVIIAFLYIIPIFFVSVFFTSSFTEEKVNRKLVILLSTPLTRLQIILGKMLPYFSYSLVVIIAVTIFLKGNVLTALSIFVPVMLFILSIYLMVALTYRTFKDQTFFSVLALSVITVYLVVPAMFTGVNNLSFVSPLTLAVLMYRNEAFDISQYFISTLPLYATFFLAMYVGTRVFNEEYLMGFKPLHLKIKEALYLTLGRKHLNISVFALSFCLIPIVLAVQLVSIIVFTSVPSLIVLWIIMLVSIVIEEIAKSIGIMVLIDREVVRTRMDIFRLSILSAVGFWAGEKILLLMSFKYFADSGVAGTLAGFDLYNGWLFFIPLILHVVSTSIVCQLTRRGSRRSYLLALISGSAIHAIYNIAILLFSGVIS